MSFIKEKSSPLLPFRWEQLYELWLDIINLCLPFNFDYDMIFSESVTEMEICFEEKRIDFYCRDPDSGGGSLGLETEDGTDESREQTGTMDLAWLVCRFDSWMPGSGICPL